MEKSGSVFVGKRKTLKRKILILIFASIIYPVAVFFICFFSLSSVTLPIIEWYHTAIIAAVVPDILIINSLYKTWKEEAALRLVKPKSYEKGIKIALAIMSVALCIAFSYLYAQSMIRTTSLGEKKIIPQYGDISYLSLAALCAIGPIGFYEYFRFKRIDRMEEKFPDFLRDLAEYWRGGLSMSAAITALAKTEYGALTKEVKKMATQISWGTAFQEVLKMFAERIRTRLIARSVSLIDEANRAGGRISDILVTASNDSREIKWLQIERKKGTAVYVIIVYVGFFVYLGIVGVLAGIFLPAVGGATKGISSGTSLGGANVSSIDIPFMCFIFFTSALIQAIGSGIVGGLMSEGKIVAGLKHSFIMVLITWLVFAGVIYPIAVDLAQPTSSVEPMAYWHTSPTFDITVSASDKMPGTGMDSVELFYRYSDNNFRWSNWSSYGTPDDEPPWEFKFDSKTVGGDGYYEFYSIATDVAGNKEGMPATADARCRADTAPPTTTITINGTSQYWRTENVTFTANTFDKYAGINSTTLCYRYRVNNETAFGSWISLGIYNVSNIASPKHLYTYQWNFSWQDGEGIYQFKAESVDNLGNKEQKDFDMELGQDLTPPNSKVTTIASYWQSGAVFDVPYTTSDNVDLKSIELYYRWRKDNSSGWNPWYWCATKDVKGTNVLGTFSFSTLLGEGVYEFYSIATDSTGQRETKSVYEEEVGYDKTPPTSAVNPVSTYWHNESITVTASSSDSLSSVKDIILYYYNSTDNSSWSGPFSFGVLSSSPWSWIFDFPDGTGYYQFYSISTDKAGNTEELPPLADILCGYDNITPESEVNPINYWQNTSTFIITANASDNISGVASVELFYNYSSDNSTWNGWTNFGLGNYSAANNVWEWNFTAEDGYYLFYSIAVDNAGNVEDAPGTADAIVGVDTTTPTSIIQTPSDNSCFNSVPIWFDGTCSNGLSGINRVEINITYKENSTVVIPWTSINLAGNYTWWNYSFTPSVEANYTIRVRVVDNASNVQETIPTINITYDITPPISSVNTVSSYWQTSLPFTITATASDTLSGVKEVALYYNYSMDNLTGWTGWMLYSPNDSASPYGWSFNAPNGDGYYQFCSIATDNATSIESAPDIYDTTCAVDTAEPIISNITPSQYISNLTPVISLTITDMLSGINNSSIVLIVNGTDNTGNATIVQIDNGYNITYIPTAPFDDGQTINVTINATDNAGNNLSYLWSFIIDISEPDVAILTPSEKNVVSPDVWFNGSCSDNISGIQYVEINITYKKNGTVVLPWTNARLAINYTWWDYNFTLPSVGNYTIMVRAVDNASNVETARIDICYNSTGKYDGKYNIELTGRFSFTLEFRTIATDSAGNVSPWSPKLDVKEYAV